jgi:hypothetical protein
MSSPVGPNPYVGLRPFERDDSHLYFGRSEQVQSLLELLGQTRFLAVVGSSGCGKSSLVRAGLIPALEGGFLVQDLDRWRIAALKPGEAPVRHLAAALLMLAGAPSQSEPPRGRPDVASPEMPEIRDLAQRFSDEGADAALSLLETAGGDRSNLLLLVDQFEELFRFGLSREDLAAREEAETFTALLLRLAGQQRLPIYVCITMRSDFFGDCDAFSGLPEAINAGQFLVPRLTRAQRRQAIEGPTRLAGGQLAPRLMDRLLNASPGTRDDLPILQHCLMRLWNAWATAPDGPIDLEHYEQVHTIHHALDRHAEEAMEELAAADRAVARALFQALTELDPGNRRIRRPARLSEVTAVAGAPAEQVMHVIDRFCSEGRNFLVLSSEDPADDPLIDISHESLIRQWQRLGTWVDEEAAAAKLYRRLAETAALHAEGKAGLYRDADLEQALAWKRRYRPNPAWARRYPGDFNQAMAFLQQSRLAQCNDRRDKKEARAERERFLRERVELAQQQAAQERAARQRARRWAAAMVVLVVVSLFFAGWAFYSWNESERQRQIAQEQTRRADEQSLAASFNLAQAHEETAVGILNKPEGQLGTREYQYALLQALAAERQLLRGKPALQLAAFDRFGAGSLERAFTGRWTSPGLNVGSVNSIAFSPDGRRLASASADKTMRLWDVASGAAVRTLEGHQDAVNGVAFSPDGRWLASASADKTVRLWDVASGAAVRTLEGHQGWVFGVAFSPDGRRLASASRDKTVRLWDLRTLLVLENGLAPSPRAALISETLQRLWGLRVKGLDIVPESRSRLFPGDGYYADQKVTIDDIRPAEAAADPNSKPVKRTFNIRPLLDPPRPGEDKLDQLLRWLKDQGM